MQIKLSAVPSSSSLAGFGRHRDKWMVARYRLGRRHIRSMALRLVDLEMLGCLYRCAKDHAP